MSKLKSPILSLGARGTIADTLTYQKRGQDTIVRKKPIPAYRYTLPQAYQRWLYKDYAYLWTQQSEATRREYAANGARFHLTGFQYWMKYQLTNLPDIAAWWKLDESMGAIAYDSSKNARHATIIGASPIAAVIDGGLSLDGINDYIVTPFMPMNGDRTIEFIVIPGYNSTEVDDKRYFSFYEPPSSMLVLRHRGPHTNLIASFGGIYREVNTTIPFAAGSVCHWVLTIDSVNNIMNLYFNGLYKNQLINTGIVEPAPFRLFLGRQADAAQNWVEGIYDNAIIYNRALDATEIKRHSERRYPL